MVSGVGHAHGGHGASRMHGIGKKGKKSKSGSGKGASDKMKPPGLDPKNMLPPGLAKRGEGKLPPGLQKRKDDGDDKDSIGKKIGDVIKEGMAGIGQKIREVIGGKKPAAKTAASPAGSPATNPMAGTLPSNPAAKAPTSAPAAAAPGSAASAAPANSVLNSKAVQDANNVLAKAAARPATAASPLNAATGGAGTAPIQTFRNPNDTGTALSSVLGNAGASSSRIIDTNVLNSLKAGDTAGFIGSLAGNVQSSLNSSAVQFLNLTA